MAELPGWDRARLAVADERDVAAAREIVFARKVAAVLAEDFEEKREEIRIAGLSGVARERAEKAQLRNMDNRVLSAMKVQAALRARLGLDIADDEEPVDG